MISEVEGGPRETCFLTYLVSSEPLRVSYLSRRFCSQSRMNVPQQTHRDPCWGIHQSLLVR